MWDRLQTEWLEFRRWAFKSWTVAFNVAVGLFAIFAETFPILRDTLPPKVYAAIFITVPMVNFFLRMKTQKNHSVALAGTALAESL